MAIRTRNNHSVALTNACARRPVITPLARSSSGSRGPEPGHRRPAADAEIAHAARAVLQVGLEEKDRVAEPAVARGLLGPQAGHEVLGGRLGHPLAKRVQERRPSSSSPVRKRASSRAVAAAKSLAGRESAWSIRPDGMPGVDLGVPQRVAGSPRPASGPPARRLGAQDQEVEIGIGRQLAAAEAARREDRHRRVALRHLPARRLDDDGVDVAGKRSCHLDPISAGAHRRGGAFAGLRKCPDDIQRHRDQTLSESDETAFDVRRGVRHGYRAWLRSSWRRCRIASTKTRCRRSPSFWRKRVRPSSKSGDEHASPHHRRPPVGGGADRVPRPPGRPRIGRRDLHAHRVRGPRRRRRVPRRLDAGAARRPGGDEGGARRRHRGRRTRTKRKKRTRRRTKGP